MTQTDNPTLQQLDPRSPGVFVPDPNGFRDDKYDHLGYLEVEEDGMWRFADIYELSQQAGIVVLHYGHDDYEGYCTLQEYSIKI